MRQKMRKMFGSLPSDWYGSDFAHLKTATVKTRKGAVRDMVTTLSTSTATCTTTSTPSKRTKSSNVSTWPTTCAAATTTTVNRITACTIASPITTWPASACRTTPTTTETTTGNKPTETTL